LARLLAGSQTRSPLGQARFVQGRKQGHLQRLGLAWPGPGGLAATTLTNMPYINTSKHVHALQREKKTIKRLTCLFYLFAQLQRSQ
jgi:hypothetical protein